ncbi:MAG: hypothetical protein WCH86_05060 [Kiritimatiellales bacterium]
MFKTMSFMLVGLMVGAAPLVLVAEEEGSQLSDNGPSRMKEKVVKARAEKHEDTGGVSAGGRKYIYMDQKDIDATIHDSRTNKSARHDKDREVNIGSTTIGKEDKVRSVDMVIKTDKKIDVKTDGKPTDVNIGQVAVEEGALKHRKLDANIIIDAEKGIVVH